MSQTWILSILVTFFLTSIFGPRFLPILSRLKFGQFVRDDGPGSHLKKQGTPTMGGVIFLIAILLGSFLFEDKDGLVTPMIVVMFGFGIVGFLDDILKIKKKQSEGLKAWHKFMLQLVVAVGVLVYLVYVIELSTEIIIPFTYGYTIDLVWAYIPIMVFIILGTVNGVNLTDGVDGLSTSVTAVVATLFIYLGFVQDVAITTGAGMVLGGLLGFLLMNAHPAKVFMGDTGSLALGGFVAYTAIVLQMPLFIVVFGIIYLVETLSVIIQVSVYKKTKKRVFKMAPIHHHFELSGMSETQVVAFFMVITIIMSLITIMAL